LPLVVKLKTSPLQVDVSVSTSTTRAIVAAGRSTILGARFDGGAVSFGATSANAMPQATDTRPGTTNAARQPRYLTSKPVDSAANAMPRLPARPLTPITRPGRSVLCTSIGIATGW